MPILTLAIKDLRLLARDRMNCFFTFIFPVVFAILFGLIFSGGGEGGNGGVPLAVVNLDAGTASSEFIADLKKDSALAVTDVTSRAEGEALVRRGAASACVVVPEGFSSSGLFSGQATKLEVLVDPARSAEAGLLQGKLTQIAFQGMGRTLTNRSRMQDALRDSRERVAGMAGLSPEQRSAFEGMFGAADELQKQLSDEDAPRTGDAVAAAADDPGFTWSPVDIAITELAPKQVTGRPKSSFQISFGQGVVWGLVGCVAAFVSSLAAERQQGTLGRLLGSPLAAWQVLAGKALACFISCVLVQGILLASVMLIARVIERKAFIVGNWPMLVVAILAAAAAFTGIMMAFASFTKTEASGGGLARAVMLVLAMIGGGTVPLFMLPRWMQTVSGVSPFRWAVLALEGSVWRGMTGREMLLPLGVLVGLAVVGFAVGAWGVRRVRAA